MKPHLSCLVALALATSVQGAWQRAPQTGTRPANVLTASAPASVVTSDKGIKNPLDLMTDDSSIGVQIRRGKSDFQIRVPSISSFAEFRFTNDDTAGTVRVYQSADAKNWEILGETSYTATTRAVSIPLTGSQTMHVKVEFNLNSGGTIRGGLLLSSSIKASDFKVVKNKDGKKSNRLIDLADGVGETKVIYVHPTPKNFGTDSFKANSIIFPPSSSQYRTIVYDLGQSFSLDKLGSIYSKVPLEVSVYGLAELPETVDWRGKSNLDPSGLTTGKPTAKFIDRNGVGNFSIRPREPKEARYVVFHFNLSPTLASSVEESIQQVLAAFTGSSKAKMVNTNAPFTTTGMDVMTGGATIQDTTGSNTFPAGSPENPNGTGQEGTGNPTTETPTTIAGNADPGAASTLPTDSSDSSDGEDGNKSNSSNDVATPMPHPTPNGTQGVGYSAGSINALGSYYGESPSKDDSRDKDEEQAPEVPPTSP